MQKAPNRACCNLTFPHSHHAHCAYRISVWSPKGGLWALRSGQDGANHCTRRGWPGCPTLLRGGLLSHCCTPRWSWLSPCHHVSCDPVNHVLIVSNTAPISPRVWPVSPALIMAGLCGDRLGMEGSPGHPRPHPPAPGVTRTHCHHIQNTTHTHNSPVLQQHPCHHM